MAKPKKMVPITNGDIKNLKLLLRDAGSVTEMAEKTGFLTASIRNWLKGEHTEVQWRSINKQKVAREAKKLRPKKIENKIVIPVFSGDSNLRKAYSLARSMADEMDNLEHGKDVFWQIANILAHKILEG